MERGPRGVVQILHGMAEYMDRYDRPAKALGAAGYLVCGLNHRGHGPNAEHLGYFADKDGWNVLCAGANFDVDAEGEGLGFDKRERFAFVASDRGMRDLSERVCCCLADYREPTRDEEDLARLRRSAGKNKK